VADSVFKELTLALFDACAVDVYDSVEVVVVVAVIVALDVCVPVRVATIVLELVTETDDVLEIEGDPVTVFVIKGVYDILDVKDCLLETVDVRDGGAERVILGETLDVFVDVELPVALRLMRPDSVRKFVRV
jgi:hypothetical protein